MPPLDETRQQSVQRIATTTKHPVLVKSISIPRLSQITSSWNELCPSLCNGPPQGMRCENTTQSTCLSSNLDTSTTRPSVAVLFRDALKWGLARHGITRPPTTLSPHGARMMHYWIIINTNRPLGLNGVSIATAHRNSPSWTSSSYRSDF